VPVTDDGVLDTRGGWRACCPEHRRVAGTACVVVCLPVPRADRQIGVLTQLLAGQQRAGVRARAWVARWGWCAQGEPSRVVRDDGPAGEEMDPAGRSWGRADRLRETGRVDGWRGGCQPWGRPRPPDGRNWIAWIAPRVGHCRWTSRNSPGDRPPHDRPQKSSSTYRRQSTPGTRKLQVRSSLDELQAAWVSDEDTVFPGPSAGLPVGSFRLAE